MWGACSQMDCTVLGFWTYYIKTENKLEPLDYYINVCCFMLKCLITVQSEKKNLSSTTSQVILNFWPPNHSSYGIWHKTQIFSISPGQPVSSPKRQAPSVCTTDLTTPPNPLPCFHLIPVKLDHLCRAPVHIWTPLAQTTRSCRSWRLHWSICCHLGALFRLSLMLQQLVVYMCLYTHA